MDKFNEKVENYKGLSSDDAANRLEMYGYNGDSRGLETDGDFSIMGVLMSLRFVMMCLAALTLLISGRTGEGFVMLLLGVVYSATEVFKGLRSRDGFYELKRISSIRFRVIRDGAVALMRREYIVPDDIIILQEGESVPADAHLLEAKNLTVDESLFTNDHDPATKRPGMDSKNELKQTCLYKGTWILSGEAVARVIATGIDTKKCRDFGEVPEKKAYTTEIETAAKRIVPVAYITAAVVFAAYFLITVFTRESRSFGDLAVNSLLPAFGFALCLVPAEIPRLIRSHYLFGAFSLLKRNCVVKDLGAVENLSSITALCVDKTGIITKSHTNPVDEFTTDPEALSKIAVLTCETSIQSNMSDASALDRAIILGATFKGVDVRALHENELICRYPFSDDTKIGGNLWNINGSLLLCIKGAPENVLSKCDVPPDYLFSAQQKQQKYAEQGHRVIAVAYARVDEDGAIPESVFEAVYTFVGLAAFENRTRDSAPAAVRSCYRAGVKVIMTTGESEKASLTIAKKIGLSDAKAMTGDELRESMFLTEKPSVSDINVFARITADQKPYIVNLLRAEGERVAVTGIGTGDIEAMQSANVGVALTQETSGAAKEACGLVLSDYDFNSVVDALKETRQIHYNIKQTIGMGICAFVAMVMFAIFCLFSGGAYQVYSMSPIVVTLPAVLLLPLLSLAFFGNRADVKGFMSASDFVGRRALDKKFLIRAVTQGLCVALAVLIVRLLLRAPSPQVFNSYFIAAFTGGLIGAVWFNLSANIPFHKLFSPKKPPFIITAIALLLVFLLTYIPHVNAAFGLTAVNFFGFMGAVVFGVGLQFWSEIPKIRDN
ncbi:MAG: HAD family hydrolase [Oscillospiraceae bacterium]|nr:HAD family hydrolase [Oscillospiraceae bacterium]